MTGSGVGGRSGGVTSCGVVVAEDRGRRSRPCFVHDVDNVGGELRVGGLASGVGDQHQLVVYPEPRSRPPVPSLLEGGDGEGADRTWFGAELVHSLDDRPRERRNRSPENPTEQLLAWSAVEPLAGCPDAGWSCQFRDREQPGQVQKSAYVVEMKMRQDDVDDGDAVEQPAIGDEAANARSGVKQESTIAHAHD